MPRVVSLLPSASEIVSALGAGDLLVGRSHECDFPREVTALPVLTAPRFQPGGSSAEIDRQVRSLAFEARAQDALGVYEIDLPLLQSLQPTHIVTQTQCEVCAVSLRDVEQAVQSLTGFHTELIPLAPNCLEDIWDDIRRTAQALDLAAAGEALIARLEAQIDAVPRLEDGPTVAVIEWADPLMTAGHWTMELLERVGGSPLIGGPKGMSAYFTMPDLQAADPDVIIMAPCGYDLEKTRRDADLLHQDPEFQKLRAVRKGRVALIDGNQFVNRPGPRVAETAEILSEILNPKGPKWGHQGKHWQPYR